MPERLSPGVPPQVRNDPVASSPGNRLSRSSRACSHGSRCSLRAPARASSRNRARCACTAPGRTRSPSRVSKDERPVATTGRAAARGRPGSARAPPACSPRPRRAGAQHLPRTRTGAGESSRSPGPATSRRTRARPRSSPPAWPPGSRGRPARSSAGVTSERVRQSAAWRKSASRNCGPSNHQWPKSSASYGATTTGVAPIRATRGARTGPPSEEVPACTRAARRAGCRDPSGLLHASCR